MRSPSFTVVPVPESRNWLIEQQIVSSFLRFCIRVSGKAVRLREEKVGRKTNDDRKDRTRSCFDLPADFIIVVIM